MHRLVSILLFTILITVFSLSHVAQTATPSGRTLTVTTLANNGRGSIFDIAEKAQDGDVITFDPSLHGSITPDTSTIPYSNVSLGLKKNVSIVGPAAQDIIFDGMDVGGHQVDLSFTNLVFNRAYIASMGTVTVDHCLFIGASTAIAVRGKLTVKDSLFRIGGGQYGVVADNLYVSGSTFIGGATAAGVPAKATATIVNSTFYRQGVTFGAGAESHVEIINSTILTGYQAFDQGGILDKPAFTLRNSILAVSPNNPDPLSPDQEFMCPKLKPNIVFDGGGNLQFPDNVCSKTIPVGDPKLGPLQDNGGLTPTMTLLPGSAAIGRGDPQICASLPIGNKDQRGFSIAATDTPAKSCDAGAVQTGK